jgi:citrate lyase subunit beta / citryl-CoA lyase
MTTTQTIQTGTGSGTENSNTAAALLTNARSFLFVPASQPDRFAKALATSADAVIFDLEDAVAPAAKASARQALADAFVHFSPAQRQRSLVRINASDSDEYTEDTALVAALAAQGLAGVVVPKAQDPQDLASLAKAVGDTCHLIPLIESVAGLDAANALAKAPGVVRLAFGHLDFQLDAGMQAGADEAELTAIRVDMVLAARRADIAAPIDGVSVDIQDPEQLASDIARSQRLGFTGKLCIHPKQVSDVNAAWTPSAEAVSWAQRVVAGAQATTQGAFSLDGKMVDAPVIAKAHKILALVARQGDSAERS